MQPLWKTVWSFLKKLKIELPYDLAIPLLGIYLKKTKILIQKDICTPMFIAASFTTSKIWKQNKCPSIGEWIKKMWYTLIGIDTDTDTDTQTHTHTLEYYSAIKKNEILPFAATWMYLGGIRLSEISQTERNTVWFHFYVESERQNKWTNKTETDSQIQWTNWWLP